MPLIHSISFLVHNEVIVFLTRSRFDLYRRVSLLLARCFSLIQQIYLEKKKNIDYLAHMVIDAGNTAANETDKITALIGVGKR